MEEYPKLSSSDIRNKIFDIEVVKYETKSGQILRWAVITMENGFAVTGKPSCCVHKDNDDSEVGEKVAIENAISNIWELEGYLLKERMDKGMHGK